MGKQARADLAMTGGPPPPSQMSTQTTSLLSKSNFDVKDHQLQIKNARTFFCIKTMGAQVKVYMMPCFQNPVNINPVDGINSYEVRKGERVVFEGILPTINANQCEIMLQCAEEKVVNLDTQEERIVNIYLDDILRLRFDTIAYLEYPGMNLTHQGIEESEPLPCPSSVYHKQLQDNQSE